MAKNVAKIPVHHLYNLVTYSFTDLLTENISRNTNKIYLFNDIGNKKRLQKRRFEIYGRGDRNPLDFVLRGIPDDLIAHSLSNLLIVEPDNCVIRFDVRVPADNKKRHLTVSFFIMVGATGIEPATPCTPCKYSTRLSYAPTYAYLYNSIHAKARIYFMLARIGKMLLVFAYQ